MLRSQLGCTLERTVLTTSQLLAGSQLPNGASEHKRTSKWIKTSVKLKMKGQKWHPIQHFSYACHAVRHRVNATAVPRGPARVISESLRPGHCYQSTEPEAVGNVGTTQLVSRRKCWPYTTYTAARKNKRSIIGQKLNSGELGGKMFGDSEEKNKHHPLPLDLTSGYSSGPGIFVACQLLL